MDPVVWATIAEFWWVAPSAAGAGAVGWFGSRQRRNARSRRLAYDAAKHELRGARRRSAAARGTAKVARAELVRVQAERTAEHASAADVAAARRAMNDAQREAKAAAAAVRVGRARVGAARAAMPSASTPPHERPLAQLMAAHDAVTSRWIAYETDAARVLAFPAMSDARQPLTAAYLTVQSEAQRLRPASAKISGARVTAEEFAAYRDAVERLGRAFDAAEKEAWRLARAEGMDRAGGTASRGAASGAFSGVGGRFDAHADALTPPLPPWAAIAQTAMARSAEAIARAAEAATTAFETRSGTRDRPMPSPSPQPPRWPVPSRDRSRGDASARATAADAEGTAADAEASPGERGDEARER